MARVVTTKSFLLNITIIYSALTMTILIFTGVSYLLVTNQSVSPDASLSDLLMVIVPAVVIVGFISGYFIYKIFLGRVSSSAALRTKLMTYQQALLIRSACLEFPAMFAGVATIITGELIFLYYSSAILFVFFALRPTASAIINDLALTSEKALLDNPNAVLYEV